MFFNWFTSRLCCLNQITWSAVRAGCWFTLLSPTRFARWRKNRGWKEWLMCVQCVSRNEGIKIKINGSIRCKAKEDRVKEIEWVREEAGCEWKWMNGETRRRREGDQTGWRKKERRRARSCMTQYGRFIWCKIRSKNKRRREFESEMHSDADHMASSTGIFWISVHLHDVDEVFWNDIPHLRLSFLLLFSSSLIPSWLISFRRSGIRRQRPGLHTNSQSHMNSYHEGCLTCFKAVQVIFRFAALIFRRFRWMRQQFSTVWCQGNVHSSSCLFEGRERRDGFFVRALLTGCEKEKRDKRDRWVLSLYL